MRKNNIQLDWKFLLVAVLGVIALYWLFFKPVTKEENEDESKLSKKGSKKPAQKAFDKYYFAKVAKEKGIKPTQLLASYGIDSKRLLSDAKEIYNAKGLINDDEEVIYNILSSYPNIVCISALAFTFEKQYKKDMITYIGTFLNTNEMDKVYSIINKKPLK